MASETEDRAPRVRNHVRCPCCGRLAYLPDGATLPACLRSDHSIDGMRQVIVGGGRAGREAGGVGFEWEPRELSDGERMALSEIVSTVAARLQGDEGSVSEVERLREEVATLRDKCHAAGKLIDALRRERRKR